MIHIVLTRECAGNLTASLKHWFSLGGNITFFVHQACDSATINIFQLCTGNLKIQTHVLRYYKYHRSHGRQSLWDSYWNGRNSILRSFGKVWRDAFHNKLTFEKLLWRDVTEIETLSTPMKIIKQLQKQGISWCKVPRQGGKSEWVCIIMYKINYGLHDFPE